jgi:hypothetical protein
MEACPGEMTKLGKITAIHELFRKPYIFIATSGAIDRAGEYIDDAPTAIDDFDFMF